MHMKIEINNPENILPPPQKSPEQTPNPSRKNPKHFLKYIHPSQKKILPEISQPPWKTPPPPK